MACDAVGAYFSLRVAGEAKAHIDLVDRFDAIHRLHRPMTGLAGDTGCNVRPMGKAHEIRKGVHPVPSNLERRLRVIHPRARHRLESTDQGCAVTSYATRDRGNSRGLRAPRILMAVLARDLVYSGMNPMTERNRLGYVGSRRPRPLRQPKREEPCNHQHCCKGQNCAVHVSVSTGKPSALPRACDCGARWSMPPSGVVIDKPLKWVTSTQSTGNSGALIGCRIQNG